MLKDEFSAPNAAKMGKAGSRFNFVTTPGRPPLKMERPQVTKIGFATRAKRSAVIPTAQKDPPLFPLHKTDSPLSHKRVELFVLEMKSYKMAKFNSLFFQDAAASLFS